jgi:hypothetical protein
MRQFRSPNPYTTCPQCGAPPRQPHHETCKWSYTNTRSKLTANEREAMMMETPPVPAPDDPDPDGDNGDDAEGDE